MKFLEVYFNGVNYSINEKKLLQTFADIKEVLDEIKYTEPDYLTLEPGLYETDSGFDILLKSWDTLVAEGLMQSNGQYVYSKEAEIMGDLVYPSNIIADGLRWSGATNLTGVVIPGEVNSLAYKTFFNCQKLKFVYLKDGITEIQQYGFSYCPLEFIRLPNTLERVAKDCFNDCIDDVYNKYENGIYLGSDDNPYFVLMSFVDNTVNISTIHPDCKVLSGGLFYLHNKPCEEVTIPNGIKILPSELFRGCNKLNKITLPSTINEI